MERKKHIETGSNEFEMVEFILYDNDTPNFYGINVAKVREVIKVPEVTAIPKSHPCVVGFSDLRGKIIPIINLPKWLGVSSEKTLNKIIITEFNKTFNGFMVNDVTRIYRLTWNDLMQPTELEDNTEKNCINAIVRIDNKMILILDFEKIIGDIFPETYFKDEKNIIEQVDKNIKILISEDSGVIRSLIDKGLKKAGYTVYSSNNGKEALDKLLQFKQEALNSNSKINDIVDVLITDLEMPIMGGENLIKNIKSDDFLSKLPIIVFSSMGLEENIKKLKALGADDFINKPDVKILSDSIRKVLKI